jgi:sulfite exporter TauE/SafE
MTSLAGWPLLAAAVTLGLAGSAHCLGMCGGIAAAAGTRCRTDATGPAALWSGLLFNVGRVMAYALLGGLVGGLAGAALGSLPVRPLAIVLRALAGLLMLAMGLSLLSGRDLLALERAGGHVWQRLRPLAGRAWSLPGSLRPAALGLLWGFLPCGLVYSALALAATSGTAWSGSITMLAFGAGTLPAMLAVTLAGTAVTRKFSGLRTRAVAGALMVVFGVWTAVGTLAPHAGHGHMETHTGHSTPAANP